MKMRQTVLVSPLNWGLGHATRTLPIVRALLLRGYRVILFAAGRGYRFYKKYFDTNQENFKLVRLPVLSFKYVRHEQLMSVALFLDALVLMVNYFVERLYAWWFTRRYEACCIISDNRFGFRSRRVKSFVISHQLYLQLPKAKYFIRKLFVKLNLYFLDRFDMCLIPDVEGKGGLSGILSHALSTKNFVYIGLLSRFYDLKCELDEQVFDIVVILSGPEPQRTVLEQKLISQLIGTRYTVLILSGRIRGKDCIRKQNIVICSHADDEHFCYFVRNAKAVIARGGYSTIMDLVAMGQSGILIPTPRQTEQEYLAKWLSYRGMFMSVRQSDMQIAAAIERFMHDKQKFIAKITEFSRGFFQPEILDRFLPKKH